MGAAMNDFIYLAHNATTPIDEQALQAMLDCYKNNFANPNSVSHLPGLRAQQLLRTSRKNVAALINADINNIIFTSGATESNNIVLQGIAHHFRQHLSRPHIIVSEIEHASVLRCCESLSLDGIECSLAPVDSNGKVIIETLKSLIKPETCLISVMAANNETGVIQPLKDITTLAKQNGILMHTDAAQFVGKMPFDVSEIPVDFMSISGHKFYGPKGIGALYAHQKNILKTSSIFHEGGQEFGIRGGTSNLPSIVGLAEASKIAARSIALENKRLLTLKSSLINQLKHEIPEMQINGHPIDVLPSTLSLSFKNISAKELLYILKNKVALSTGSACHSESYKPSHVLKAMGLSDSEISASIRISLGKTSNSETIDNFVEYLKKAIQICRQ